MVTKNDPKNIVTNLLEECLKVHKDREKSYDTGNNVFQMSADIFNVVFGVGEGKIHLTAEHIAFVMVAMKLARYGNCRLEVLQDPKQLAVIWDTIKDTMVYVGLTERERQYTNTMENSNASGKETEINSTQQAH